MRWLPPQKAKIDSKLSVVLDRYGVGVVEHIAALGGGNLYAGIEGREIWSYREEIFKWLKEQHDQQEFEKTWQVTMEASVCIFVLAELVFSILNYVRGR
jgi:hypothetical protein